jgi:hypothetical protein
MTHPPLRADQAALYRIELQGRLDPHWSEFLDGLAISAAGDPPVTTVYGTVADQPALFGLLARVRDLGLPLLSVTYEGAPHA